MLKKNKLNPLFNLVDNSTIISLIIISTITSILLLVIPVTAQTLVNFIAFGHILRPVLVLSIMVFVLIISAGFLNLWHNILIEVIQQKIMVNSSLKLTERFSRLSYSALQAHDNPKEVNKYFDIVVIVKSIGGILSYGINLVLQVFFGLIVLLIYHPYFIIFDLVLVCLILIIICIPFRTAKSSAYLECQSKHAVAEWFDEIILNRYLFKFLNFTKYLIKETDERLTNFLKYRNKHFRQLIKYEVGFVILAAVSSSILLGLGGYLVIKNQLSLGQLVAAEIILGSIVYSLNQFVKVLEEYHDLSASFEIFEELMKIPVEEISSFNDDINAIINNFDVINLKIENEDSVYVANPGNPLLVKSLDRSFIENLITNMIGLTSDNNFKFWITDILCNQHFLISLRRKIMLVQEPQWIAGTIYDNLVLNTPNVSMDLIIKYINILGLTNKITNFKDGLSTYVSSWQYEFTEKEAVLLMILRVVINSPTMCIFDRTLDLLDYESIKKVLEILFSFQDKTYVIITQRHDFPKVTNCWEKLWLN